MPKLISHEDEFLTYEVLSRWTRQGHEVALIRLTNKTVPDCTGSHLMCECDFDVEDWVKDGKVVGKIRKNDPHKCEAKKSVREAVVRRTRKKGFGRWKRMGLKKAILDIHLRTKEGEFFGQHDSGTIYTQMVAQLLGREHEDVLKACGELYAEERLDLNGRILTDYVPCFRFPVEMAAIMRYVVEEPLGWPNGDAGDCWLGGFEREVQERHGFKSGKEAFGKHWPNIDGRILAEYALDPVVGTLRLVAPLFPKRSVTEEGIRRLTDEAVDDGPWIGKALNGLKTACPEASVPAFLEFIRALLRLSFERVDMDRQMRTQKVPPAQTLTEMAEFFEKLAAHFREQEKKT